MRTKPEYKRLIENVVAVHEKKWADKQPDMNRYRSVYETRFFANKKGFGEAGVHVETSDAYTYIESFIMSLFSKSPAVEVKSLKTSKENVELTRQVINDWFKNNEGILENGSRLALIFPMSFFKIAPQQSDDPLNRVTIRAINPWEVILDDEASKWDEQRYCGHLYFLPVKDANRLYGTKAWKPVEKENYFGNSAYSEAAERDAQALPDEFKYIKIAEFYDMVDEKLIIWSPNYKGGIVEVNDIPLTTFDERPLIPIAPLYYSRLPHKPLEGYSALSRVYDQFFEKNILRTFWANAVRRDSRQFVVKRGAFDDETLAKISAGVDGTIAEVNDDNLAGIIREVPVGNISTNFDRYQDAIESDIARGSILTPNARGEATKATATEVTALAQYTSSEIGRMAKERDNAIAKMADIYIRMMVLTLDEEEKPVIMVGEKPAFVTSDKLDHSFQYYPLDQAATPLNKELRKQQLVSLMPSLLELGVPKETILKEMVREFDLPDAFLEIPEPQAQPAIPPPPPEVIQGRPTTAAGQISQQLIDMNE